MASLPNVWMLNSHCSGALIPSLKTRTLAHLAATFARPVASPQQQDGVITTPKGTLPQLAETDFVNALEHPRDPISGVAEAVVGRYLASIADTAAADELEPSEMENVLDRLIVLKDWEIV
ncbi:hypothetical protein BKA70DRAFT_1223209 [Coprinopsis sp. MPI-PUGE-AT-0042]|nr:hypothetical protein BKA70DRAFT_1223209 [Coprinopsis sp. MPI-PUGE-AT-0042]